MWYSSEYIHSNRGIIKFLEVASMSIAFSCLAAFHRDVTDPVENYPYRFIFFISVGVTGFLIALFVYIVFVFKFEGRILTVRNWNLYNLLYSMVFAGLFGAAAGLMTEYLDTVYDVGRTPYVFTAAIFFGYSSCFLLLLDAYAYFQKMKE